MTKDEEIEANIFAAHLLVPTSLLRQEVNKLGREIDLTSDEDVAMLAEKFQVSVSLMTVRLLEEFGKALKVWQ